MEHSPRENSNLPTIAFDAIGTHWTITIETSPEHAQGMFALLRNRIEQFESTYSRFRDGTIIDQMSKKSGVYILPEDARPLFDCYQKLYHITSGKVTPLIGNTLVALGYDKTYSFKASDVTVPPLWEDTLDYHFPTLTVTHETQLDLGALGKGHLVDIVGELIEQNKITNYIVNAGGDIRTRGNTITIGLENPSVPDEAIGTYPITNMSICGSSGNRRAWKGINHIIDPTLGASPTHISALWVIAKSTMIADGLATALFFTPPTTLKEHFDFSYIILFADGSVRYDQPFKGELFGGETSSTIPNFSRT